MELFSKLFWRRTGWLAGLVAILILVPLLVLWWQWVPPVDMATVEALAKWADAKTLRNFGPPNVDGWRAAAAAWDLSQMKNNPRLARVTGRSAGRATDHIAWAQAFEPDYSELSGVMTNVAQGYLDAAAGGTAYPGATHWLRRAPEKANAPLPPGPDYLAVQAVARWLRLSAERAMERGEWHEALGSLGAIVSVERGIEPGGVIGSLVGGVALRAMAYDGYAALLQCDPPPEVLLEAIARMRTLHLTDPHDDATLPIDEKLQGIGQAGAGANQGFPARALFEQAAVALALQGRQIEDPALRRWAGRYDRTLDNSKERGALGDVAGLVPATGLSWTTLPAARKFVRSVLARESAAVQGASAPAPGLDSEKLDPLTRLEFTHATTVVNFIERPSRMRNGALPGWVIEAALRARYFRATQDRWPETMAELDAALPLTQDPFTGKDLPFPAPQLTLEWIETRNHPDLRAALWGTLPLPRDPKPAPMPARPATQDAWDVRWFLQQEDAILPVAYREALAEHPRLVTQAEALYWFRKNTNAKSAGGYPLSDRFARAITDWADKAHPGPGDRSVPTGNPDSAVRISGLPQDLLAETDQRPPESYELRAHLIAPDRVLTIRTVGPDGQDRGGLVAYDPTNGTRSPGDVLAFPERF